MDSRIHIVDLLALVFIVLKLMGYINWAWYWVLAPIWIPYGIIGILILVGFIYGLFAKLED